MANTMKKERANKNNENLEDIKSDFITIASHQLRTPISAVRWSLDTLLSGKNGVLLPRQIEVIKEAYQNNNFMVKVVNDLLRVSRLEEKGINLSPQYVNLIKYLEEIVKRQSEICEAYNCKIIINKSQSSNSAKAYFDPFQLKSVFEGIIDNAIRYGKAKGRVEISLKKENDFLLCKIRDRGIGIPQDQQDLIFSKFFRGRNAIKAQTEGLGLNLYLARKIIKASGGKIEFSSQENKGTTFHIYLPSLPVKTISNGFESKTQTNDILKKEREFVAITVHELKAPLGISKWSLEMLKSGKAGSLTAEQLELIDQIYRGNERLLVLVRDLLNLAKLQEGKFEVKLAPTNIKTVINDVVKGFRSEADKKKIKFDISQVNKNWPLVLADQSRIAQVMTNLISNAVKYTPENGQVIVNIEKKTGPELKKISNQLATAHINFIGHKNGYLVISVTDTGIGIAAADQRKLFSRFFRSSQVLKSKTEGTGLGLYITRSIVNLHKGDIWFTSQLGRGSTFYFSLSITQ
jgi:signal transduction histidine kinase